MAENVAVMIQYIHVCGEHSLQYYNYFMRKVMYSSWQLQYTVHVYNVHVC